jgi:hypothetical protein
MNFAFGQSSEKPFWATSDFFMDLENSYIETIVVTGEGTRDAMREKAREIIVLRRDLTRGARVYFDKDETENKGLTVASKAIGEYIDGENFVGYFLMQTLKNPTYKYEKVNITDHYRFSARVFVPGMAQLYKGSKGKGVFFIAVEATMVGGIIVGEVFRNVYLDKIKTTNIPSQQQMYYNNAQNWKTVRNISISGAALVYAYSLFDGIFAKGKSHIEFAGLSGRVTPFTTFDGIGLTLIMNFNN